MPESWKIEHFNKFKDGYHRICWHIKDSLTQSVLEPWYDIYPKNLAKSVRAPVKNNI